MGASTVTGKGPGSAEGQTKGAPDRQTLGHDKLIGPQPLPSSWAVEQVVLNRFGVDATDAALVPITSVSRKNEYLISSIAFVAGTVTNPVGAIDILSLFDGADVLGILIGGLITGPLFNLRDNNNPGVLIQQTGSGGNGALRISASDHVFSTTNPVANPGGTLPSGSRITLDMSNGRISKLYDDGDGDVYFVILTRQVYA